ncbi:MAG: T9SS type A sorting domain-containing protein [Crocinitomicaceae bacterium]
MRNIIYLLLLLLHFHCTSQTLPAHRSVNWKLAGLRDTTTNGFIEIDMQNEGAVGDGLMPNDSIMGGILAAVADSGAILTFPSGNFLFNETIDLPSNVVIKGDGAESTTFTFDLGGSGHSIKVQGQNVNSATTSILDFAAKDDEYIFVDDPTLFSDGDWIRILQNDSNLVTSSWAYKTVGQVVQISSIVNQKLFLESPLRMDYDTVRTPYVVKMTPVENVGIECLKIHRLDDTAPSQSCNIHFSYAVNCWVNGIESENCTFSHIEARRSSNIHISKSYFHHGFDYGGGGRAYGVMLHITANECMVENNIFEHLRHSMIVQAGANGNVFAYNYSHDPYWSSTPNNSAGDAVLHGNYTYANLFEQNICQNIVIDNSHGPNGPYNTIFRNRSEKYGIFFSATNSPDQNFLGNEITNTGLPYSIINYTIQGSGHFIHGNNNKGTIHPSGTETLPDSSYAYEQKPDFLTTSEWTGIGTPNSFESGTIPAYERYQAGTLFINSCGDNTANITEIFEDDGISIFPNPVRSELTISSKELIERIEIVDVSFKLVARFENVGFSSQLNTEEWNSGVYIVNIYLVDKVLSKILIKSE